MESPDESLTFADCYDIVDLDNRVSVFMRIKTMNLYGTFAIFIFSIVFVQVRRIASPRDSSPPRGCRQDFVFYMRITRMRLLKE